MEMEESAGETQASAIDYSQSETATDATLNGAYGSSNYQYDTTVSTKLFLFF